MCKSFILLTATVVLVPFVPSRIDASDSDYRPGYLQVLLGTKALDSSDWGDLSRQTEFGLSFSWARDLGKIRHSAIDILKSSDTQRIRDLEFEGNTVEIDIGLRAIWGQQKLGYFAGGGLAGIRAQLKAGSASLDDWAVGAWIDGGAFYRFNRHFNAGIQVRVSVAEASFRVSGQNVDIDAGGQHAGLMFGFGW